MEKLQLEHQSNCCSTNEWSGYKIMQTIGNNDSERIVLGGRGGDKSHPQNNIPLKVSWADIVTGKR